MQLVSSKISSMPLLGLYPLCRLTVLLSKNVMSQRCLYFFRSLYFSHMVQKIMKEGKLVPSDVTVRLLQQAMQGIDNDKFLIDGFPRDEENVKAFEDLVSLIFCSTVSSVSQ